MSLRVASAITLQGACYIYDGAERLHYSLVLSLFCQMHAQNKSTTVSSLVMCQSRTVSLHFKPSSSDDREQRG